MNTLQAIFWIMAAITVGSALALLLTRQVLYAAYALLITFLGIAGLYVLAGADFIAITQILVYAGGILVLIIFGVMFTNRTSGRPVTTEVSRRGAGLMISGGLFSVLLALFFKVNLLALPWVKDAEMVKESTVKPLGVLLLTEYLLPFEIAGLLLLVALVGAAFIAKQQKEDRHGSV